MDPTVEKQKKVEPEPKKETKKELDQLKCPKMTLEDEKKLLYGESIALNSARQFDKYMGNSIDKRGAQITQALSTGTQQVLREFGLAQTTKNDMTERERFRQETEMAVRRQHKRKTSIDLEEEEKLVQASRDEVAAEIRQDIASRNESDGGDVHGEKSEEREEVYKPHFDDDEKGS